MAPPPPMDRLPPPPRPRAGRRGFSLVEVALALGVTAFVIAGVLGLFPGAAAAARAGRDETVALLIAASAVAGFQAAAGPGSAGKMAADPAGDGDRMTGTRRGPVAPTAPAADGQWYGLYDRTGAALPGSLAGPDFALPAADPAAAYGARLEWRPEPAGVTRLTVTVETPMAAPGANRQRTTFVTLLGP